MKNSVWTDGMARFHVHMHQGSQILGIPTQLFMIFGKYMFHVTVKLAVTTFKFYLEFIRIGDHNLKYTPLGCSPLPARETSRRAVVTPMDP